MENIHSSVERAAATNSIPYLDKEHGYYGSATVTNGTEEIFTFCKDPRNVEKVLANLPKGTKNFLQLRLVVTERIGPEEYRLRWENRGAKAPKGTLTFLLKPRPHKGGTIITAEAVFEKIKFKEEGPSTLMNIFLKRMKALMETGVLATTAGQPSGREELSPSEPRTIH